MCNLKSEGGRCSIERASSKAVIQSTAEQVNLPKRVCENIFHELLRVGKVTPSNVVHSSHFLLSTGELLPDGDLDEKTIFAQNRLESTSRRAAAYIDNKLSEISSFSGVEPEVLRKSFEQEFAKCDKANSEKYDYRNKMHQALKNVKESYLVQGSLVSSISNELESAKINDCSFSYHEESGRVEVVDGKTGKTKSYKDVTPSDWSFIKNGIVPNRFEVEHQYEDEEEENFHSYTYKCYRCGQFKAVVHSCSMKKIEPKVHPAVIAKYVAALKGNSDKGTESIEEYRSDLIENYDPSNPWVNPTNTAEQIENNHRNNIAKRALVWRQIGNQLAENQESQILRLEHLETYVGQSFIATRGELEEPNKTLENVTGGACDVSRGGRGFGLEIEVDSNLQKPASVYQRYALQLDLYEHGLISTTHRRDPEDAIAGSWNLVNEGTAELEVVSPILSDRKECWEEVELVCSLLRKHGYIVNERTGGHVNIDITSYERSQVLGAELTQLVTDQKENINSFAIGKDYEEVRLSAFHGNNDLDYSKFISTTNASTMSDYGREEISKTRTLNLHNMYYDESELQRAEFRSYNGTLELREWQQRVALSAALLDLGQIRASKADSAFESNFEDKSKESLIGEIGNRRLAKFIRLLPMPPEQKKAMHHFAMFEFQERSRKEVARREVEIQEQTERIEAWRLNSAEPKDAEDSETPPNGFFQRIFSRFNLS